MPSNLRSSVARLGSVIRECSSSALGRAPNKFAYGETDLAVLAAAYAFRISRNHPFVDGNKRAALAALLVFLRVNDVVFAPDAGVTAAAMLGLAAGELDEDGLTRWIKDFMPK